MIEASEALIHNTALRDPVRLKDEAWVDEVCELLVGMACEDRSYGARPLRRALQKHVESPLSVKLLAGEFRSGDMVIVDTAEQDGEQVLVFNQPDESEALVTEEIVDA